jgi:hypothetical protein
MFTEKLENRKLQPFYSLHKKNQLPKLSKHPCLKDYPKIGNNAR